MNTIDRVFSPEHSDFELGDVYERDGMRGVMDLTVKRKGEPGIILPNEGMMGLAAWVAYFMGQAG